MAFFCQAIYEVSCGEEDLVEDMQLVQKTYADSLLRLNILTAEEVRQEDCVHNKHGSRASKVAS